MTPRQKVIYVLEREGPREGPFWLLLLACGHVVSRSRVSSRPEDIAKLMSRPIEARLAPRSAQCHYCEIGCPTVDPWIRFLALGGSAK